MKYELPGDRRHRPVVSKQFWIGAGWGLLFVIPLWLAMAGIGWLVWHLFRP